MTRRRNRKLKSKKKRQEKIKRERRSRRKGEMVSTNRKLDYHIQRVISYPRKGDKGNAVVRKAVQHLRVRYPELFRLK